MDAISENAKTHKGISIAVIPTCGYDALGVSPRLTPPVEGCRGPASVGGANLQPGGFGPGGGVVPDDRGSDHQGSRSREGRCPGPGTERRPDVSDQPGVPHFH